MWQLQPEKEKGKRIYKNSVTNSECSQTMCYTDKEGNSWYEFESLTSIPYTRQFAATKISSLYALGLSKDDLSAHINGLKSVLKSNDAEKYEKAFSLVLDFESKANNATDPIKQMSSLVCVYFTINDEHIDSFIGDLQLKKMSLLEADFDAHAFFLRRQITLTENFMNILDKISRTALAPMAELSAPLQ